MKKIILAILLCGPFGCSPGFSFSKKPPQVETPVASTPTPTPSPKPIDATAGRKVLTDIATKDVCANAEYGDPSKKNPKILKDQGRAASGYLKGLVLTYVKLICEKDQDPILKQVYDIGTSPVGDPAKDALAHYGLKPATPTDRLNTVFAMMIGSNARESSWRPCVGRDTLAKASDVQGCLYGTYNGVKYTGSGATCESGLAQTSYNSLAGKPVLKELFESYMQYPRGCFEQDYYSKANGGKITCTAANWENHGSDPKAKAYQALSKSCPAFTVESGVVMFRTNRAHYGPLNKKKAEVYPACVGMFERVRQAVVKDPTLCYVL